MTDPFGLMLLLGIFALLPFIAVVCTSFIKLSVVFLLVRNALGVQQIPPNMALNALAIILSGYIMAPVFIQTYGILGASQMTADRSFFLVDEKGVLRQQWLLGAAGGNTVMPSEPILKAIREIKGKP